MGLPLAVERWVLPNFELTRPWVNAIACFCRIMGLMIALPICARLRVLNRMCMYRGAINKVLNAYETQRREPSLEDAEACSRVYHQSDTAFLVVVMVVSIVAFALIRTFTLPVQLLVRVLVLFAVAAVVNEPIQALEKAALEKSPQPPAGALSVAGAAVRHRAPSADGGGGAVRLQCRPGKC